MNQTPERINIKDLVIDTPDQPRHGFFNVQEVITDQKWGYMCSSLRADQTLRRYDSYLGLMADMVFLFPERPLPEIDPEFEKSLVDYASASFEIGKVLAGERVCRKYPTYFESHFESSLTERVKMEIEEKMNALGNLNTFYLEAAAAYKILRPDDAPKLEEKVWNEWRENCRNLAFGVKTHIAANLRIVWPEKFKDLDLSPLENELDQLKDIANLSSYATFCRSLAIIFADDIEFANHQLKIINHPKLAEPTNSVPETRRF